MEFLMERMDSLRCTGVFSYELRTLTNKDYWGTTVENVVTMAIAGEQWEPKVAKSVDAETYTVVVDRDNWYRVAKDGRVMKSLPVAGEPSRNLFIEERVAKRYARRMNTRSGAEAR